MIGNGFLMYAVCSPNALPPQVIHPCSIIKRKTLFPLFSGMIIFLRVIPCIRESNIYAPFRSEVATSGMAMAGIPD